MMNPPKNQAHLSSRGRFNIQLRLNSKNYSRLDPVSEKPLPRLVREQGLTINSVFDVISVSEDFRDV